MGRLRGVYRSFGVDRIEQRDDRNTLLASDLTVGIEIALGFGRAFAVRGPWAARRRSSQNVAGRRTASGSMPA
jgi:hypothetical protein